MSAFSTDWLALREPADHAARDLGLAQTLADWARGRDRLRVLDLGAGTGSNLRYLAPLLDVDQTWRLVDQDAVLLSALPEILRQWARRRGCPATGAPSGLEIQLQERGIQVDWSQDDLAGLPGSGWLTGTDLVTASALLDLASADWVRGLAERARRGRCAVLLALTYDGRVQWRPKLPDDPLIAERLNRHQCRDKGLGPALGPEAASHAAACFRELGYRVVEAQSDWALGPESVELQERLASGWTQAACEVDPSATGWTRDWLQARREFVRRRESWLSVGHRDLLGFPDNG